MKYGIYYVICIHKSCRLRKRQESYRNARRYRDAAVIWNFVESDGIKHTRKFVPFSYAFVKSESAQAYFQLFTATKNCTREFCDMDLEISFASLDHLFSFADAFRARWPQVKLLTCGAHAARKIKEKARKSCIENVRSQIVMPHLRLLYKARTREQLEALAILVLFR
ncbi:TPA: hypothetical protein N0F65_001635 [Lagenidium giganteum]|uniref:Transposase n=1 Tax=Lagenidium giganteum TaxID=4803 RepID=A0AAV2YLQ2_9STRA|nr:TPA: hypothetical protein N0F65_001635 [Lagenidium giganteum]